MPIVDSSFYYFLKVYRGIEALQGSFIILITSDHIYTFICYDQLIENSRHLLSA